MISTLSVYDIYSYNNFGVEYLHRWINQDLGIRIWTKKVKATFANPTHFFQQTYAIFIELKYWMNAIMTMFCSIECENLINRYGVVKYVLYQKTLLSGSGRYKTVGATSNWLY